MTKHIPLQLRYPESKMEDITEAFSSGVTLGINLMTNHGNVKVAGKTKELCLIIECLLNILYLGWNNGEGVSKDECRSALAKYWALYEAVTDEGSEQA